MRSEGSHTAALLGEFLAKRTRRGAEPATRAASA
jgi:hypothetical protein